MAEPFRGYIRKIDMEPKAAGPLFAHRIYAHVFLENKAAKLDAYTDNPRLEAALLASFDPFANVPPEIEVTYEEAENANLITRVALARDFNQPQNPKKGGA